MLQTCEQIGENTAPFILQLVQSPAHLALDPRREGHGELVGPRDVVRDGLPLADLLLAVHLAGADRFSLAGEGGGRGTKREFPSFFPRYHTIL